MCTAPMAILGPILIILGLILRPDRSYVRIRLIYLQRALPHLHIERLPVHPGILMNLERHNQ